MGIEINSMCQTCGCTPCEKCGGSIENGVCAGCNNASSDCKCADTEGKSEEKEEEEENKESEE